MTDKSELKKQIEDSAISVDLGSVASDSVTGFTGTVTAITLFDRGSPRVLLEALDDNENKVVTEWFDAARVK